MSDPRSVDIAAAKISAPIMENETLACLQLIQLRIWYIFTSFLPFPLKAPLLVWATPILGLFNAAINVISLSDNVRINKLFMAPQSGPVPWVELQSIFKAAWNIVSKLSVSRVIIEWFAVQLSKIMYISSNTFAASPNRFKMVILSDWLSWNCIQIIWFWKQ